MENKNIVKQETSKSEVIITDLKTIKINGVTKIISASSKEIVLLINGNKTHISGSELFVERLLLEQKIVEIVGNVFAIKFNQNSIKPNIIKRIFS